MANVHGLYRKDSDSDDDENNRFVGGISDRGGGSGLAVQPNNDEAGDRDRVFGLAEDATVDDNAQVRRTITMYRDGFVVDDGPYRRLDDPENADFLRALAMGHTPRELFENSSTDGNNVVVGLVDKRNQDYVEEFRSFSGAGNSLRNTGPTNTDGAFTPDTLPDTPSAIDDSQPTTSIAVRLLNGKRKIVKLNLATSTVNDLASHLSSDADGSAFRLVTGFPPKPLTDPSASIQDAGLKGAQVSMQKS